jgi:adenosylcobinamide kinase / adenosylcobinamide-phosphate guanylyltransferase
LILVTGGSRSGKSDYALHMAEALPGPRAFVATCPVVDEEMSERVRKHQQARSVTEWHTIEEPLHIADVLKDDASFRVFLVDCLTLWINNLMFHASRAGEPFSEQNMALQCEGLLRSCSSIAGTVFLVTNEIGSGIVPGNALSRRYRDLVGRCNHIIADAADRVVLVCCGLPLILKERRIT